MRGWAAAECDGERRGEWISGGGDGPNWTSRQLPPWPKLGFRILDRIFFARYNILMINQSIDRFGPYYVKTGFLSFWFNSYIFYFGGRIHFYECKLKILSIYFFKNTICLIDVVLYFSSFVILLRHFFNIFRL